MTKLSASNKRRKRKNIVIKRPHLGENTSPVDPVFTRTYKNLIFTLKNILFKSVLPCKQYLSIDMI